MIRLLIALCLAPVVAWATCTPSDSYMSIICADSPKHYYRMDASSGTTETDVGTDASTEDATYNGTFSLSQTSLLNAITDKSASFNGTTGYLSRASTNIATSSTLDAVYTAEAWVNMTSTGTILNVGDATHENYVLQRGGSGTVFVQFYNACTGVDVFIISPNSSVSDGVTFYLAFTSHGKGSGKINASLYLNGASTGTPLSNQGTSLCTTSYNMNAARRTDAANFVNGRLDEIAVYDTELSAARILAHYNAGIAAQHKSSWPWTVKRPELPHIRMREDYFAQAAARGYNTGHLTSREIQPQLLNVAYPNFAVMPWGNVGTN